MDDSTGSTQTGSGPTGASSTGGPTTTHDPGSTTEGPQTTAGPTNGPGTTPGQTSAGATEVPTYCDGCEQGEIGPDEEVEEGFTALEALARLDGLDLPFVWNLEVPTETTIRMTAIYEGGTVMNIAGPECDMGVFLIQPCKGGLVVQATLDVTTADGLLGAPFVDQWVRAEGDGNLYADPMEGIPVEDLGGTLAEHTFFEDGQPVEFDVVMLSLYQAPAGETGIGIQGCNPERCYPLGSTAP
jgi:hypothetical protein